MLIGAATYASADLEDLPAVERNVAELYDLLTDPSIAGFAPEHCLKVINPAAAGDLLAPIMAAAAEAKDVLLIYFAGHGLLVGDDGEFHLAVRDSSRAEFWSGVEFSKVATAVRGSSAAAKVLILDSCFSGRALRDTSFETLNAAMARVDVGGSYVLASSASSTTSLTGTSRTVFTGHLVDILREGDSQRGDLLPIEAIYPALCNRMRSSGRLPQQRIGNAIGDLALVRNLATTRRGGDRAVPRYPHPKPDGRRIPDDTGDVWAADPSTVAAAQPAPSLPEQIYGWWLSPSSRKMRSATWRALRRLAVGEDRMSQTRRVKVAVTRLALLAAMVVGLVTLAHQAHFPAIDHLTWLSAIGAAAVACAGAAYKQEWMFSTSIAVVVTVRWAAELTSISEERANIVMAVVLGSFLIADRLRSRPRATLFRNFALLASIAAAISWSYLRIYDGYEWWPALLDRLHWFMPSIVVLAQLAWERDLDARRVSGAMATTLGGIYTVWAILTLNGATSVLAGTTPSRAVNLICGLLLLTGGATALRYRPHAY